MYIIVFLNNKKNFFMKVVVRGVIFLEGVCRNFRSKRVYYVGGSFWRDEVLVLRGGAFGKRRWDGEVVYDIREIINVVGVYYFFFLSLVID